MAKDDLIDSHVSTKQCKLAVDALHTYAQKKQQKQQENELLPGKEEHVWLVVAVKKMHPEKKMKPFKIPIAHPLVDPRTSAVCLITKDPQREYKDLLESHGIKFISRVVGITKLKGKFKPFEARRLLLKENGMFLADERVVPLLPGLLGKKWFEAKKQPIPVCLTRKDLKAELERAISSTYMHQNQGTCTSVKVGTLSQTPAQVLANIKTALPAIIKNIKGSWDNIQSLNIKTNSSVSLPLWTCNLDEGTGGRWNGLIVGTDEEQSDEEELDEDINATADKQVKETERSEDVMKGRKRASEREEVEKPKKKPKGPEGKAALVEPAVAASETAKAKKPKATPLSAEAPLSEAVTVDIPSVKSKKRQSSNGQTASLNIPVILAPQSQTSSKLVDSETPRTSTVASIVADILTSINQPRTKSKGKAIKASEVAPSSDEAAGLSSNTASDVPAPLKSKKKKHAKVVTAADGPPPSTFPVIPISESLAHSTPLSDNVEAPDSAQRKKASRRNRRHSNAADNVAVPEASALNASTAAIAADAEPMISSKKKRKSTAALVAPTTSDHVPANPESSAEVAEPSTPLVATTKKKRSKKTEVETPADIPVNHTVPVSLSKDELKQKRSAGGGERKKDKVVDGKPRKSAKDLVIGKKR